MTGLLFTAKNPKRVPDIEIDRNKIINIGRKLGFTSPGARMEFEKLLNVAQSSGITREEVHDILQKMLLEGKITKDQARRMTRELGITRKDLVSFKDMSESRLGHQTSFSANDEAEKEEKDEEKKEKLASFEEKAKEIKMEKIKASDPDSFKDGKTHKDPHRLQKIADEKVKKRREDQFQKKLEDIKKQRQEHLYPEISDSQPSDFSKKKASFPPRSNAKTDDVAEEKSNREEFEGLQKKVDEKKKKEREIKFRDFMARMKTRRMQDLDKKDMISNSGKPFLKKTDSYDEESGQDFTNKPGF